MSKVHRVAVLVGSLRKASINRRLALALAELAPATLQLELVEIGDLPLYNEDIDGDQPPQTYSAFRSKLKAADAVLFVTPEYNRSIPAPMKNAIDVASRPRGQCGFSGKPGAVLSASPGKVGGFGANQHLRQAMVSLDVRLMLVPEAYLGGAGSFFGEDHRLDADIQALLQKFIDAFAQWVQRHSAT
ncbi:NAD(P)H-dependent oxidoreductase [Pseudomonas sp. LPB0260]|uniref:NADPH-dependent FMN reductase n=1 Tax=Pseudomonas sp. LPB0260 TaxID=2614442 RepID=UPI0015C25B9C|nr:NADPH-dependent FMN reductase [Pseudomonas sp. LPB0260]QLC72664.1 NAD(P)H-dependent oxidoreductase [Pseudomonas sp. LPB0260]QLC75438.1 NAD(P)H-dependent oxidoreductase [Pseudomonas sp. LPB0260]